MVSETRTSPVAQTEIGVQTANVKTESADKITVRKMKLLRKERNEEQLELF